MINVGIIGCGNISTTYMQLAPMFAGFNITACGDLNSEAADQQAREFNCRSCSVTDLLADSSIDLILNLTTPSVHFDVSAQILSAGKHVYSEKPFVLSLTEGQALQKLATANGVRIGSAPDTFLGGAHQAARQCIDSGDVGDIVGGSCCFQTHGMEGWHPNPDFFFKTGGGPVLDMGPYYVSNLVQFLGPVARVVALSGRPRATRTITSEPRAGETIAVEIDTSVRSILEFSSGAQVSFAASWDVRTHEHNHMELYGSKKTLYVPDPNRFGEEVRCSDMESETIISPLQVLGKANFEDNDGTMIANYRGVGLADMVAGIQHDRPHRCNGELALHVIDTLTSLLKSAESGEFVTLKTTCERPAALNENEARKLMA